MNYTVSDKHKEYFDDLCAYYYEISSEFDLEFDYILLKNFYTAKLDVLVYMNSKWKSVLKDYTLMSDSESDEEGERYVLINKAKSFEITTGEFKCIRIYITQDCSNWKTFGLSEIKLIKEDENNHCNHSEFNLIKETILMQNENTDYTSKSLYTQNTLDNTNSIFKII